MQRAPAQHRGADVAHPNAFSRKEPASFFAGHYPAIPQFLSDDRTCGRHPLLQKHRLKVDKATRTSRARIADALAPGVRQSPGSPA